MTVVNRETLEDVISRIVPEDYKGDRRRYRTACKAAALHAQAIFKSYPVEPVSRADFERRWRDAVFESLAIRDNWRV